MTPRAGSGGGRRADATATPQAEVAPQHPKVTLIANALGAPPADMIKHIRESGRKVAARWPRWAALPRKRPAVSPPG